MTTAGNTGGGVLAVPDTSGPPTGPLGRMTYYGLVEYPYTTPADGPSLMEVQARSVSEAPPQGDDDGAVD